MPATLTYLRIDRFRRVRPGTLLQFGSQLNTVVGRNGTGKTTLLELISAIIRNNFHAFAREDFKLGFRLIDGELAFEGTLTNDVHEDFGQRGASKGGPGFVLSGVLSRGDDVVAIESNVSGSTFTHLGNPVTGPSVTPEHDERQQPLVPLRGFFRES